MKLISGGTTAKKIKPLNFNRFKGFFFLYPVVIRDFLRNTTCAYHTHINKPIYY